jgi:hypothetical protein
VEEISSQYLVEYETPGTYIEGISWNSFMPKIAKLTKNPHIAKVWYNKEDADEYVEFVKLKDNKHARVVELRTTKQVITNFGL